MAILWWTAVASGAFVGICLAFEAQVFASVAAAGAIATMVGEIARPEVARDITGGEIVGVCVVAIACVGSAFVATNFIRNSIRNSQ